MRASLLVAAWTASVAACGGQVPQLLSPADHFGFAMGAAGKLANWDELSAYYEALARAGDRVAVDTLGFSTAGRPFVMLTITSPENHRRLDRLKEVQLRLADPRTHADGAEGEAELEALLEEGRTVVMITHAIHSTEVGTSQSAAKLAHRLASATDEKTMEILDNVIVLQIPSLNPDGTQWVNDFYNEHAGTAFDGSPPPWLYHFYTGHDNNRDWYTFYQKETQHTVRAQNEWHPQVVHDIHQMGGGGARMFFPPYIDPMEPNVDPALVSAVNQLGTWMAAELVSQGKNGVVVNAIFDGFHPGRAYMHYHGGARILSETASARLATTVDVPAETVRGGREYDAAQAAWNFPWPWRGGEWGLPEIVEYQFAGAMALLSNAARNRRFWLENFHRVTQRAVEGWDEWPAAWAIPAEQGNRLGVESVLRILAMGDVEVRPAEASFEAGSRSYPAGSHVVLMRQPWASFAQTLLVEQEYPDLREYLGDRRSDPTTSRPTPCPCSWAWRRTRSTPRRTWRWASRSRRPWWPTSCRRPFRARTRLGWACTRDIGKRCRQGGPGGCLISTSCATTPFTTPASAPAALKTTTTCCSSKASRRHRSGWDTPRDRCPSSTPAAWAKTAATP